MHSIVGIVIGSFVSLFFLAVAIGVVYADYLKDISRGPFSITQVLSFLASYHLEGGFLLGTHPRHGGSHCRSVQPRQSALSRLQGGEDHQPAVSSLDELEIHFACSEDDRTHHDQDSIDRSVHRISRATQQPHGPKETSLQRGHEMDPAMHEGTRPCHHQLACYYIGQSAFQQGAAD